MKKKCYKCGKIREGKVVPYLFDYEKDETYEEFFCEECLRCAYENDQNNENEDDRPPFLEINKLLIKG